jgi:hypothetical protein
MVLWSRFATAQRVATELAEVRGQHSAGHDDELGVLAARPLAADNFGCVLCPFSDLTLRVDAC